MEVDGITRAYITDYTEEPIAWIRYPEKQAVKDWIVGKKALEIIKACDVRATSSISAAGRKYVCRHLATGEEFEVKCPERHDPYEYLAKHCEQQYGKGLTICSV